MNNTATLSAEARNVSFMLEKYLADVPGVEQVIGVSSDGLLMAMAAPMDRGEADKLAATVSGATTLAVSAGKLLGKGALSQVITEFQDGYFVATLIKNRSCLGVVTTAACDLGQVGYEATMLVERIGAVLTPALITELKGSLAL